MKKKLLVGNNSFTKNPPVSDSSPQGDSKNTQLFGQHNSAKAQPSLETLQSSLMYLMSKFALTQEKPYAEAVYQHLHMLAVRCDTNSKPRFLYRSLAMDWAQMCRGQVVVNGASPTGPH